MSDAAAAGWRAGRETVETLDVVIELAGRLPSFNRLLGQQVQRLKEAARGPQVEAPPADAPPAAQSPADQEVLAVLREATWGARRELRQEGTVPPPLWSSASHRAVRNALGIARAQRVQHAHGMHLFLALLEDPTCRATETLASLGVARDDVLRAVPVDSSVAEEGTPIAFAARLLGAAGVLQGSGGGLARRLRYTLGRLVLRSEVGVVVPFVEQEAIRQAVRLGAAQVDSVGLLAAVLSLDEQLTTLDRAIARPWAAANAGGEVLRTRGIDVTAVAMRATALPQSPSEADRTYRWRSLKSDPPFGADAAAVTRHARQLADRGDVGTSHLLLAMLALEGSAAHRLLRGMVNLSDLREDLAARLAHVRS